MAHAAPGLNVEDVLLAIAWYARLGFSVRYQVPGEDPPYAVIGCGDLGLHLRRRPLAAGTSFCYLVVDDAQEWFDRAAAAGVVFRRRIERSDYGMRDFEMMDLCG